MFPVKRQLVFLPVFILTFLMTGACFAQAIPKAYNILEPLELGYRCRAEVQGTDTIPVMELNTIYVYTEFVFKTRRQREAWTAVKSNVKKVYPYAILAAAKLKEYDQALAKMQDEQVKKAFIKICEKDLRNQFEEELKALSVNQGKILMKLIDRESGKTTYEVVKQLRGGFQAAMWQTVARIFGHNMKSEYDAQVEDIMIERAVKLVESGQY